MDKPVHALVVFQQKQLDAIKNIERQLKVGYIDLIDSKNSDEIHIIRRAIEHYKKHLLTHF